MRRLAILTLSPILMTMLAASPAQAANTRLQAESYTAQQGTHVVPDPSPSGGLLVGGLSDGDWLRYDGVVAQRARVTLLCFSSPAPAGTQTGTVEIRIGSLTAAPLMQIPIRVWLNGGFKQWANGGAFPDGTHTVYLTIRQPSGASPFNLDYLYLSEYPPPPSLNCS